MKTITKILIVALFGLIIVNVQAQSDDEKKLVSGNSFNVAFPVGDMASTYDFGWGIYGNVDYNFNKFLAGRFDLGWNTFSGPDISDTITGLSEEVKTNVWEFTAGLRVKVAIFYVEARGGYFTGVDSWGFVPAVGLRFKKFDLQGNLTVAGDNHWGAVRLAYYWGG